MARTTSKNFLLKSKIFLCGENISKSCFGAKKTQNKKLKFPIHKNFDAQKIFQRVVFIKKERCELFLRIKVSVVFTPLFQKFVFFVTNVHESFENFSVSPCVFCQRAISNG